MFGFFRPKNRERWPSLPSELSPVYASLQALLPRDYQLVKELELVRPRRDLLAVTRDARRFVVSCWESPGDEQLRRHERNFEVVRRLRHPGILPVLDSGSNEQWCWWLRPWVEGETLEVRLGRGPVELAEGRDWMRQVVEAIDSAHSLGVVHRGIRPENIWIESGRVLLADFAVEDLFDRHRVQVGTDPFGPKVPYLAPEQIMASANGPESDYYSLGTIAFLMFTGRFPFEGDSVMQAIIRILQETPPRITEIVPDLPESLAELVASLLVKDPVQRLSNAGQILDLLDDVGPKVTDTSHEMEGLLSQLQQEGSCVGSVSTFTLDPRQALKKLQGHQFVEDHAFLLALGAAANALGCPHLEIASTGPRVCTLTYREVELSRPELENLWSFAFARDRTGLTHLALGLAAALARPKANLNLTCAGWGVTLQGLQPLCLTPSRPGCLTLTLKASVDLGLERGLLTHKFGYSRTAITLNRDLLTRPPVPNRPPISIEGQTFAVFIGAAKSSQWTAVVDGMSFPLQSPKSPPLQVIVWGPFQVDLSYRRLVLNHLLTRVMKALNLAADEAAEELAMGEESLNTGYLDWALKRWKGNEQVEMLQACYENLLRQALELSEDRLSSPPIGEAWHYIGGLPNKPAVFWQLHTRLFFLGEADVATLGEVARNAFANPREGLEWHVKMWIEHDISEPGPDQVEWLLAELRRHQISPQRDQDRRLASLLGTRFPHADVQRWLDLLPRSWVQTRARLRLRL